MFEHYRLFELVLAPHLPEMLPEVATEDPLAPCVGLLQYGLAHHLAAAKPVLIYVTSSFPEVRNL
jgi:hypothetical protein